MKKNKPNLLSISGKLQSGKNTVASIIQYLIWKDSVEKNEKPLSNYTLNNFKNNISLANKLSGFEQKSFAHKLKQIISLFTNIPIEDLEKEEVKNKELGEEWWYYKNVDFDNTIITLDEYDKLHDNKRQYFALVKPTPRLLMQNIGSDCFRNIIHPNIHIIGLFSDYHKDNYEYSHSTTYPNWLVTDVRHINELDAIESREGISIRVNRYTNNPLIDNDTHVVTDWQHSSETELDNCTSFNYVINNDGGIDDLIEKVREILQKENLIS